MSKKHSQDGENALTQNSEPLSEEQSAPHAVDPQMPKKKRNVRKALIVLITLSALAAIAIYFYNMPRHHMTNQTLIPEYEYDISYTKEEIVPDANKLEVIETQQIDEPEEIIETKSESFIQKNTPSDSNTTQNTDPKPFVPNSKAILTAIELRDSFKTPGKCRPLLEELMKLPSKTPEINQALSKLLPACLDHPLHEQMKETFFKTKKKAIFRIFQQEYPFYTSYLKVLPYYLADIHKKNPTDKTPLDILDKIQNAVIADHPAQVIALIPTLPDNVQATLNEVYQYALAEQDLYVLITRLTKALLTQGANND